MSIGVWQVVLILAIVLIIFGAGKLPRVMGDVAKGVKNFKSGLKDVQAGDDKESLEQEAETTAKTSVEDDQPAKN
ncbi:MAG: twin-arginine translocase TatA/TatE family subunit [Alphaproteobacteria bacterium]